MAVTLRFQSSGAVPGDGQPIVMRGPSLTIGRGQENDVVLPDPDRMISKTHCALENHNGNVVVVDFSTNGTFLNYGKVALGRTATPINDGDVLIMGAYELVVQITSGGPSFADPMAPMAQERASFGNANAAPDPYKLLDDAGPGGDFLDGLLGGNTKPTGPGQFRKQQEDFVELLPPLGDDGPLLGPAPEMPSGPAMRDHSASVTDSFLPAGRQAASKSVIPDDWDDLLAPTPPKSPAKAQKPMAPGEDLYNHAPAKRGPAIPDDDIFGASPPPAAAPRAAAAKAQAIPDDEMFGAPPAAAPVVAKAPSMPAPEAAAPQPVPVPQAPPSPTRAVDQGGMHNAATDGGKDAGVDPFADSAKPYDPFATDLSASASPKSKPAASAELDKPAKAPPRQAQVTMASTLPTGQVGGIDAARAFLIAVGAEDLKLSDAELPDAMVRLGRTMKSMIIGLREILMTRTSIKSEFRIEQTMVNSGGNNPLKFSVSPEQAIQSMVKPSARGYLPADEAATQALEDIKAHEIAMVTGMEAALKGVLAKLDPKVLTEKIEGTGGFSGFMKNRKAQYWETYEAMYAEISDQAENDFHELFAREFSQAYRAQLARLKEAKAQGKS